MYREKSGIQYNVREDARLQIRPFDSFLGRFAIALSRKQTLPVSFLHLSTQLERIQTSGHLDGSWKNTRENISFYFVSALYCRELGRYPAFAIHIDSIPMLVSKYTSSPARSWSSPISHSFEFPILSIFILTIATVFFFIFSHALRDLSFIFFQTPPSQLMRES